MSFAAILPSQAPGPGAGLGPRDRTAEFRFAVNSALQRDPVRQAAAARKAAAQPAPARSAFLQMASELSRDLARLSDRLKLLAQVSQKYSVFDDSTNEFQSLADAIRQEISRLNINIPYLQRALNNRDFGRSESAPAVSNLAHMREHANQVILFLQNQLASSSTDFKNILEQRTTNVRTQKTRRDEFAGTPPSMPFQPPAPRYAPPDAEASARFRGSPPMMSSNGGATAIQIRPTSQEDALYAGGNPAVQPLYAGDPGEGALLMQHHQNPMHDMSATYMNEQNSEIRAIEATLAQLGGVFEQLTRLISQQAEQVERIDTYVDEAEHNVSAGQRELVKYLKYLSSGQSLALKLIGLLTIVAVVFIFLFV